MKQKRDCIFQSLKWMATFLFEIKKNLWNLYRFHFMKILWNYLSIWFITSSKNHSKQYWKHPTQYFSFFSSWKKIPLIQSWNFEHFSPFHFPFSIQIKRFIDLYTEDTHSSHLLVNFTGTEKTAINYIASVHMELSFPPFFFLFGFSSIITDNGLKLHENGFTDPLTRWKSMASFKFN